MADAVAAQVTAAYATATNEILLQHYGFVDMHNIHDEYTANILDFIEETVIDQPNEEQLQAVRADPKLSQALSQVLLFVLCMHEIFFVQYPLLLMTAFVPQKISLHQIVLTQEYYRSQSSVVCS